MFKPKEARNQTGTPNVAVTHRKPGGHMVPPTTPSDAALFQPKQAEPKSSAPRQDQQPGGESSASLTNGGDTQED